MSFYTREANKILLKRFDKSGQLEAQIAALETIIDSTSSSSSTKLKNGLSKANGAAWMRNPDHIIAEKDAQLTRLREQNERLRKDNAILKALTDNKKQTSKSTISQQDEHLTSTNEKEYEKSIKKRSSQRGFNPNRTASFIRSEKMYKEKIVDQVVPVVKTMEVVVEKLVLVPSQKIITVPTIVYQTVEVPYLVFADREVIASRQEAPIKLKEVTSIQQLPISQSHSHSNLPALLSDRSIDNYQSRFANNYDAFDSSTQIHFSHTNLNEHEEENFHELLSSIQQLKGEKLQLADTIESLRQQLSHAYEQRDQQNAQIEKLTEEWVREVQSLKACKQEHIAKLKLYEEMLEKGERQLAQLSQKNEELQKKLELVQSQNLILSQKTIQSRKQENQELLVSELGLEIQQLKQENHRLEFHAQALRQSLQNEQKLVQQIRQRLQTTENEKERLSQQKQRNQLLLIEQINNLKQFTREALRVNPEIFKESPHSAFWPKSSQ